MLLDINAYVGHWPFKQLQYNTCAKLLDKMNKFAVNVSVISNLNGVFYKNTQSANEELYEELGSEKRFGRPVYSLCNYQSYIRRMEGGF
jgi:uncharacterized protein